MRQSGDWTGPTALSGDALKQLLGDVIAALDVGRARREVEPFVRTRWRCKSGPRSSSRMWPDGLFLCEALGCQSL